MLTCCLATHPCGCDGAECMTAAEKARGLCDALNRHIPSGTIGVACKHCARITAALEAERREALGRAILAIRDVTLSGDPEKDEAAYYENIGLALAEEAVNALQTKEEKEGDAK